MRDLREQGTLYRQRLCPVTYPRGQIYGNPFNEICSEGCGITYVNKVTEA